MKKTHVYGIIMAAWFAVCVILYVLKLIDWIGIMISFIFAIPPIIIDLVSTNADNKRKKKLEQVGVLHKFLKYLDDMTIDNMKVNNARQRSGAVVQMGLINIEGAIHSVFNDNKTKTYYEKSLSIAFSEKKCKELYKLMEIKREDFIKELNTLILTLNPNENEIKYYNLILTDNLKRELFLKQHKEIA